MSQQSQEERSQAARAGDRRGTDRRKLERRSPPPPWRRWWALVGYGVVGALALVMLLGGLGGGDDKEPRDETLVEKTGEGATAVAPTNPAVTAAGPEDAYGTAGFERLVVEGEAAVGKTVRAELFCEAPQDFTIIAGHTAPRSVASLIQGGRVRGSVCKWGPSGEPRREDLLLIVPAAQAEEFAAAPVVTDNFVERRRVVAEMEWVGRSETLALRTAAVFRRMVSR
ncbi:MAG TPA: hypothetical protein VGX50_00285 [Longimicrobium sp.]|jgi:hypothetical protein|nr:hypothetical protein [Longimicrobium sp.]